jgi:large subunit ribosomal protein L25
MATGQTVWKRDRNITYTHNDGDHKKAYGTCRVIEVNGTVVVRKVWDGRANLEVIEPAVVKEMQRHPIRRTVNHIDFLQVNMNEEITVHIAVRLEGESKAVAAMGGLVDASVDHLEVSCTPTDMPNEFVIDISDMQPDTVIRLSDIPMPKGVTALGDPDMAVVTVLTTAAEIEEPVAAVEGEGEGEEAPAADGDASE